MKNAILRRLVLSLNLLAVAIPIQAPIRANEKTVSFVVPSVKIPLNVKDQRIVMVASGLITLTTKKQALDILDLRLEADLSDLQLHMTDLLSEQIDKDDRCGDHIAIQNATLTPAEPSGLAVVRFHYERWACVRVLGRQQFKRIVGGNAVVQMKLTPAVEENNTTLRLIPEVGPIQADGSLGELLRSGALGDMLREKIRSAILNALQKGTDLNATLPPAVQGYAKIKDARFKDAGSGRLLVSLAGEIQITKDQIQALSKQVKERTAIK